MILSISIQLWTFFPKKVFPVLIISLICQTGIQRCIISSSSSSFSSFFPLQLSGEYSFPFQTLILTCGRGGQAPQTAFFPYLIQPRHLNISLPFLTSPPCRIFFSPRLPRLQISSTLTIPILPPVNHLYSSLCIVFSLSLITKFLFFLRLCFP